jgi:hypothetical protein
MILTMILWSHLARAANCPGADDEPALSVKTKAGPTLILCGFEDHEIKAERGRRAFSEFQVYAVPKPDATPEKVYASEGGDTHWASVTPDKTLLLEELWIFADKPHAAIARPIACAASACKVERETCVLNLRKNMFPKSLPTLHRRLKSKKPVGEDAEDLLDEVWAQALTGETKAAEFYDAPVPAELDSTLGEVFAGNLIKLKLARQLKCKDVK